MVKWLTQLFAKQPFAGPNPTRASTNMDFERGIEFDAQPTRPVNKESSYSEEDQAKVIEGSNTDIKQVGNKRKRTSQSVSHKEKIIKSYRNNLERIISLVESLSILEGTNHRQEEQIVEEIKNIRHLQEELLNALLLEQKGVLSEESISKEAWSLIQ